MGAGPGHQTQKASVLLVVTGTPDAPTPEAVKTYLAQFLSDRRLIDLPRWKWMPILHAFILPRRSKVKADEYAQIWTPQGSPLMVDALGQAQGIRARLQASGVDADVAVGSLYGSPSIDEALDKLLEGGAADPLVVLPCYPQYASVTTGGMVQSVFESLSGRVRIPDVSVVGSFCDDAAYLDALSASICRAWTYRPGGKSHLLFCFHSTLVDHMRAGDTYQVEVERTCAAVAGRLGIPRKGWSLSYMSVFDKGREWLGPLAHEQAVPELAERGVTDLAVVAPGFTSECLETLRDIDKGLREKFGALVPGGSFTYVPCLGDDAGFLDALAGLVERRLGRRQDAAPGMPSAPDAPEVLAMPDMQEAEEIPPRPQRVLVSK